MIHAIVAMDNLRGVADHQGIPWKLPADTIYYKNIVKDKVVAMGRGTYLTHAKPFSDKPNYVLSLEPVRDGFTRIESLEPILKADEDVWVIGGAHVFDQLIDYIDKLYITRVDGYFSSCTKFFPEYKDKFTCLDPGEKQHENSLDFYWEIWKRTSRLS